MTISPLLQPLADALSKEVSEYLEAYNAQEKVVAPKLKAWKESLTPADLGNYEGDVEEFSWTTLDLVEDVARTHESPTELLSLRNRLQDIIAVLDDNLAGLHRATLPKSADSQVTMDLETQYNEICSKFDGLAAMAKSSSDMIDRAEITQIMHGYTEIRATGKGGSAFRNKLPSPTPKVPQGPRKTTGANKNSKHLQLIVDGNPAVGEDLGKQVNNSLQMGLDDFKKLLASQNIDEPFKFLTKYAPWNIQVMKEGGYTVEVTCHLIAK